MLGLGPRVRESLLDGHQQLVPQRFIDKSAIRNNAKAQVNPAPLQYMFLRNILGHRKSR